MHRFLYVLMIVALLPAGARAADWTAVKLRGMVFANNVAGNGPWVRLKRGDIVDDARVIRTLGNGNVAFQSGDETIAFGPQTQAEIIDRAGRRFTTVAQQAGTVAVSAEAREVQHFSVETPYLVAVVKGTVFTVTTGARGSGVSVSRGLVSVTDRQSRSQVLLPAGRSIVVTTNGGSTLSGQAVPALVHPRINGVVEDDDTGAGAPLPGSMFGGQGDPDFTGYGIGTAIGDIDTDLGSTIGGLGQGTGFVGSTVGSTVAGIGNTVTGLGQTAGTLGTTLRGTVGNLGSGVSGLNGVTGGLGSTLGTVGTTLGNTVAGVGATVTNVGGTVKSGGAGGGVVGGVTGAVGGVLGHLGL